MTTIGNVRVFLCVLCILFISELCACYCSCICVPDRFSRPTCSRLCIHCYHRHHHQSTRGIANRSEFFPTVWNPLSVYTRTVHWHPKMFPIVVLWTLFRRQIYCWQTDRHRQIGSRQWKRPTANCTPTWLDRLRIPRHLSTLFPFGIGAVVTLIYEWARDVKARDRHAQLQRPRRWLHQPRRDKDETLNFETKPRRDVYSSRDVIETLKYTFFWLQ